MGYSASATLTYGYAFPQEYGEPVLPELPGLTDEERGQLEDNGAVEFIPDYLVSKLTDFDPYGPFDWQSIEQRNARSAAYEEVGVTLQLVGDVNYEYGQYVLEAHYYGAEWGDATRLPPLPIDTTEMDAKLDRALEVLGIEKPAEGYGWYLAASYG